MIYSIIYLGDDSIGWSAEIYFKGVVIWADAYMRPTRKIAQFKAESYMHRINAINNFPLEE